MTILTFAETPKTRKAFLEKFKSDHVFKARAEYTGFRVVGENVILPNGKVASPLVKQGESPFRVRRLKVWHTTFNRENMGSNPIGRTLQLKFAPPIPYAERTPRNWGSFCF